MCGEPVHKMYFGEYMILEKQSNGVYFIVDGVNGDTVQLTTQDLLSLLELLQEKKFECA